MEWKDVIQGAASLCALIISTYSLWLAKRKDTRETESNNPIVIVKKPIWSVERNVFIECIMQNRGNWPIVLEQVSMPQNRSIYFKHCHAPTGVPTMVALRNIFQAKNVEVEPGESGEFAIELEKGGWLGYDGQKLPVTFWIAEYGEKVRMIRITVERTIHG